MPPPIAPSAAVERLQGAGFYYRNGDKNDTHLFEEYERQTPGFLQRVVVYAHRPANGNPAMLDYAVLRTKCSPKLKMFTVYDVEHLLCRGPDCVSSLLDMADAHLEQFATAGGASFFSQPSSATPHYDIRQPLVLSPA